MKQLFVVSIERDILVMAEDEFSAERVAERHEREEMGNTCFMAASLATARNVPPEWLDCLPYGGDEKTTVRKLLDAVTKIDQS